MAKVDKMKRILELKLRIPMPEDIPDLATPEGQAFLANPQAAFKEIFPNAEVSFKIIDVAKEVDID